MSSVGWFPVQTSDIGNGPPLPVILTVSAATVLTGVATYIRLDTPTAAGAFAVTMPAANALPAGYAITFKDLGQATTKRVTLTAAGADTIDGAATWFVGVNWDAVQLVSNGTNGWEVL